jgi:putative DNA primase/helicase
MKEKLEKVRAFRKALQANGYVPLAVSNAVFGDKNTGKNPVEKGWQETTITSPITVERSCLNTGILAAGLYAVDQDTDDQEISEAVLALILEHFGAIPLVRFRSGSFRFLALFRSEGRVGKQKIGASGAFKFLEVLSDGQQFVADGSHFSGTEIEWADGISPANFPQADLPLVSADQMTAFLLDAKELFGTPDNEVTIHGYTPDYGRKPYPINYAQNYNDKISIEDLSALLDDLNIEDDYFEWLRVVAAIHAATDGSLEGKDLANKWSRKGNQDKYNGGKGVNKKWDKLSQAPMRRITAGTLFYKIHQQDAEWVLPSLRNKVQQEQRAYSETLARLNKKFWS